MKLLPPAKPAFHVDFDRGWIGFVHHHSFVADGIMWFTKWWRHDDEPGVSHVFIVSGPDSCIEANAQGVQECTLAQYFLDPKCTVYLRKPFRWSPDMADRIVADARTFIGEGYDFPLIAADLLSNSLLGHAVNGLTHDAIDKFLTAAADNPRKMICDKLAAVVLDKQPELSHLGTLAMPAARNNPQELFSDECIFAQNVTVIQGQE